MEVTLLGIVIDVSPLQPEKAYPPMYVTVFGTTNLPSLSGGQPYSPGHGGMVACLGVDSAAQQWVVWAGGRCYACVLV